MTTQVPGVVQAANISHSYGDQLVLDHVDVQVRAGEWLAVCGPSGSGKSTLLNIIGMLQRPDEGHVSINGIERVHDLRGRDRLNVSRRIGWVFQSPAALPRRSTVDNVAIGVVLQGVDHDDARRRALEVLDRLDIAHLADRPVRDLSGGERQRVGIARALATDPTLIVADEPTGQLDATTTDQVLAALRRVVDGAAALLVATHDDAVASQADRILELRDGATANG